jgi:hypothetical protein
MTTNESVDDLYLFLDEQNKFICVRQIDNDYTFANHTKYIQKNMFCIYQNICTHDNKIYKNILLDDGSLEFFIFDNLSHAYKSKDVAFFDKFIENEQWKYFEKGYSGICKKYSTNYKGELSLVEEYYMIDGKKSGIHTKYDMFDRLIIKQNYINDIKLGEGFYYEYNLIDDGKN